MTIQYWQYSIVNKTHAVRRPSYFASTICTFCIWKTLRLFNSLMVSNLFDFMCTTRFIFVKLLSFFCMVLEYWWSKTGSPILQWLQTGCGGQKLSFLAYSGYESYHMIFAGKTHMIFLAITWRICMCWVTSFDLLFADYEYYHKSKIISEST